MAKVTRRLGEVEPRERAGAQTGRKYEYQYERTARAALDLLADGTKQVCVYCDWHDDFVAEIGQPPTCYVFNQVKGRTSSQGPWTFREFFGVSLREDPTPAKKAASIGKGAVAPLLFAHHINFGPNCAGLFFITNAGLEPRLSAFLESIAGAQSESDLAGSEKAAFDHLARAYRDAPQPVTDSASQLFGWIRGLTMKTDHGSLESQDLALLELASVIADYSEIELVIRQAKQIAREVVSHVRSKVAHSSTIVPATDEQLRINKGVVVIDLLRYLSLSAPAYEALKTGTGKETVKTLSRLERFCKKRIEFAPHLTQICQFKAQWDVWRTTERHFLGSADYMSLEHKANELIHSALTLEKIIKESRDIAKQFDNLTHTSLTAETVLGLVFALAAAAEAVQ